MAKDEPVLAAGIAFIAPEGRMLFLKRSSRGDHPGEWCLPGGGLEPGENARTAARREAEEETGMVSRGSLDASVGYDGDEGLNFTTFFEQVGEESVPRLNDEHDEHAWASPSNPPKPLHPGVEAVLPILAMKAARPHDIAFDAASVRTYDRDGRLHVAVTNISKAAVNPYRGAEIPNSEDLGLDPEKIYNLLRHPDELAKAAPTFNNIPLLNKHVTVNADDHQPDLVIGSTGTDAEFAAPFLRNSLVVWARDGIKDVEADARKELSCSYRYRAKMTPGTYEGIPYDGVMLDIVGNHVALVKEGRAGADVVVGDSMENLMSKTVVLTRKAAIAQGACIAFLAPRLAKDAKFDTTPIFAGITTKNFKEKKSEIAKAITDQTKDMLAKDANIAGLVELLDAVESVVPAEDAPVAATKPNASVPAVPPKKEEKVNDADPLAKLKAFLAGKVSDDDLAQIDGLMAADDPPPFAGEPETDADDEDLEDNDKDKDKDMVTKAAMDSAIAAAVKKASEDGAKAATKTQVDIRAAEKAVRPYVGELGVAHDSAEAVYRTALGALGVKVDDVHPSALPAILAAQPVPGARKPVVEPMAMDAAQIDDFNKRTGGAASRIRIM